METEEIERLVELINADGRCAFGIRSLCGDEDYKVGETARPSYDWDHETDRTTYGTDGEREIGTAAIQVGVCDVAVTSDDVRKAVAAAKAYGGRRLALLASDDCTGGEDVHEVDLRDAEVLAVWEE